MPRYRAHRFINERSATHFDFEAENDETARNILLGGADLAWSPDADAIDPGVTDEVHGLDRICEDGSFLMIEEEIPLPGEKPYSREARNFTAKVAALPLDAHPLQDVTTLHELILEARTLCGDTS
jgi:hypothetical protein